MKPLFHPELVNGTWGDPALYIECLFERRSLLFDLGDLHALAPRKILRLSDVFVSHTHMDHFMGFDRLLRICLGRQKKLCLYGPDRIIDQVEHKLGGYTWNLVENYEANFTIDVTEYRRDLSASRARFSCLERFARQPLQAPEIRNGTLLEEPAFSVRAAHFDHKIPTLGFVLEESQHINVWKNRLQELQLPTGPWLRELKRAIQNGARDSDPFLARWRTPEGAQERLFTIGELKSNVLRIVPGQKIAYATDLIYHDANQRQFVQLARGADMLYIESTFLQTDAEHAAETYHLTARQAGLLARDAGIKSLRTFHYSPRYGEDAQPFEEEAGRAFSGMD